MNKHVILKIVSYAGLALSVIPAFMVFKGSLGKDTYVQLMNLGMLLWFGTAVFWIRRDDFGK